MAVRIANKEFFTTEELAKKLNVHPITILRYIKSGKLKAKKTGKRYFVQDDSVVELLGSVTPEST